MARLFNAGLRRFNVIMAALYLLLCTAFPVAVAMADYDPAPGAGDTVPAVAVLTPAGNGVIMPAGTGTPPAFHTRPVKYARRVFWRALSVSGHNPPRVPVRPHSRRRNYAGTVSAVSVRRERVPGSRRPVSGHVVRFMHPAPVRGGRCRASSVSPAGYGETMPARRPSAVIVSYMAPTTTPGNWCHITGNDR